MSDRSRRWHKFRSYKIGGNIPIGKDVRYIVYQKENDDNGNICYHGFVQLYKHMTPKALAIYLKDLDMVFDDVLEYSEDNIRAVSDESKRLDSFHIIIGERVHGYTSGSRKSSKIMLSDFERLDIYDKIINEYTYNDFASEDREYAMIHKNSIEELIKHIDLHMKIANIRKKRNTMNRWILLENPILPDIVGCVREGRSVQVCYPKVYERHSNEIRAMYKVNTLFEKADYIKNSVYNDT